MRDYITKNYALSIDFLDYSKNNNTSISIQNKDIVYSEKDTNTAFIEADLFADGKPIDLRGYNKVVVGIKKSDGLRVQNDCTILDALNGQIEIPFTTQSLASVGVNYFDITLYKEKTELVSPKFSYRVMEAMIDDDTLESSNEFGTLVLLIEKTEELLNRTNEACDRVETLEEVVTANELVRNTNEEVRKTNEASRVSSENTRKSNETNRINSENIRVSSENARVSFYNDTVSKESIRVTKENERIASENTRILNETNRTNAENTRKSNETTRVNSENVRVSAENTRKSNETNRVSNEQTRVTNETNRESEFETLSNNMVNTNDTWNTQFQEKYDNLNNEYSNRVVTLEEDILNSDYSEELFNENVTSFKAGTGTVEGIKKDYTIQMEQSLVSINNIVGKSTVVETIKGRKFLVDTNINSICSVDTASNNLFDTATQTNLNGTVTRTGNTVRIQGNSSQVWSSVSYKIDNLEIGEVYNITCDSVIVTSGGSAIECADYFEGISQTQCFHSTQPDKSANNYLFKATNTYVTIRLHSNLDTELVGDVTYNNISIRKVSDYTLPKMTLGSVPNGISDKLENGIIKRKVSPTIYFSDLTWYASTTNNPNATHLVYYAFPKNMKILESLSDENLTILCNALEQKPQNYTNSASGNGEPYSINCISGHTERSEVRVKINKSIAPDLNAFLNWINEGTCFKYELEGYQSEVINTSVLAINCNTIFIDTPLPLNCAHEVQLNSKSQVAEMQHVLQREKKSVWNKLKQATEITYYVDTNGFIKFPPIFGGLILQWGRREVSRYETIDWVMPYNISFNSAHIVFGSMEGRDYNFNANLNIAPMNQSSARVVIHNNNPANENWYTWLAIGR